MSWQRVEIEIPSGYGPNEREEIAEDVIEFIINRSKEGRDKNNKKFPRYSKSYAAIKGVSRDSVDLTLSDEMLNSLEFLSSKKGKIVVGFDKGDAEMNARAEGNILGSYGGNPKASRARDFLGIAKKDLDNILSQYPMEQEEGNTRDTNSISGALARINRIIDSIDFD